MLDGVGQYIHVLQAESVNALATRGAQRARCIQGGSPEAAPISV
jgi:hypothetical protein